MKISFKYYILGLVAGVIFLAALFFGAPLILQAIDLATHEAPPTEEAVCEHLDKDVDIQVKDCAEWLRGSKEAFGEYYGHRLRCYVAADTVELVKGCDSPGEYMKSTWE